MYFSIGGHPAFPVSAEEGRAADGLLSRLLRWRRGNPKYHSSAAGDFMENKEQGAASGARSLSSPQRHLFKQDTMIFEKQTTRIRLVRPDKSAVCDADLCCAGFGVWSPPGKQAPFICIEPWYGRCDNEGFSGDLRREKDWIQRLEPNEVFEAAYFIEFS